VDDRDKIEALVVDHLYNSDRRWMFLKIEFPKILRMVNLDGSCWVFASQLYSEAKKNNKEKKVLSRLKEVFA